MKLGRPAGGRWRDGKHRDEAAPGPVGGVRTIRMEETGSANYISHERGGPSSIYARPQRGAGRHERERGGAGDNTTV
eukprot:114172-Pleurochrysis_carterae.AAC.1